MISEKSSGTKAKILIVDDEVDIAELVAEFLEVNYQVVMANNVTEACAKISENQFDIIVTDLHLPDCRGQSSVCHLRKTHFAGPILLVTGQDEFDPKVKQALADGAQGLVKKPFTLESFEQTIFNALNVKKAG